MSLTEKIKQEALQLGFDLVGITDASAISPQQAGLLADWLNAGCAGQMNYMHNNFEKRIDPAKLLDGAQSVICVGLNYTLSKTPNQLSEPLEPAGAIAAFAQYEDYHPFISDLLYQLTDFINSTANANHKFKICVDSAPLAERALASRAGLGFIGKNHMLINPTFGLQIFLGEIITDLKLQPDEPLKDNCSNCSKCTAACPTGALCNNGKFDANTCISYLTIEYKDHVPITLAEKVGNRLFGCDECVLACPYQNCAPPCRNRRFKFYPDRAKFNLREILDLTPELFETTFTGSAIKRLSLERLKRNAGICLANKTGLKD